MLSKASVCAAFVAALLAGCNPAASPSSNPPHPSLAGQWRGEFSRKTCARESVRFVGDRILMRREGRDLPVFNIIKLDVAGATVDLELEVADIALAAMGANQAKAKEIAQHRIFVTLTVDDDSIRMRDGQMSDPKRGRYVPNRREREKMAQVFAWKKCIEKTS